MVYSQVRIYDNSVAMRPCTHGKIATGLMENWVTVDFGLDFVCQFTDRTDVYAL